MPGRLSRAHRLIVKIGSALLVDPETGAIRRRWFAGLAEDIARCRLRGQEVLVVSSGSIALGRRQLGFSSGPLKLEESQAAAAIGQIRLAHAYQEALGRHGLGVAQILLTLDDTEQRRRYLNARNTLVMLVRQGAVPVINENDTVATNEIRYGDNDRLAGRVAQMVAADCLVLLSDVPGLHTADPAADPKAEVIPEVREITPEIMAMAGATRSDYGTGGMVTKLEAGRIALAAGCHMVIADGHRLRPLAAIEEGAACTWFVPEANPRAARKQWIAGALKPAGGFVVDAGAARALARGKSLLPAGVVAVEGEFDRGEAVVVKDAEGRELGRGLSAYAAADARRIIGRKSCDIESLLGYRGRDEMIHRDDLVMGRAARGAKAERGRTTP